MSGSARATILPAMPPPAVTVPRRAAPGGAAATPSPAAVVALRRRRLVRRGLFVAAAALLLVSVIDHLGLFARAPLVGAAGLRPYAGNDWARFDGASFAVAGAADDGTLELIPAGGGEAVRVVARGVYLPRGDEGGAAACRAYVAEALAGRRILLRLDPVEPRDARTGRVSAYLYAGDEEMLNVSIVRAGHAYADRRTRHPFEAQVGDAEARARKKELGLWADGRADGQPAWRREWLRGQRY